MKYFSKAFMLLFMALSFNAKTQTVVEETDVMEVIDAFMTAIDEKDTAAFNALLIEEAVAFRIQESKIVTRALKMQAGFPETSQWKERLRKDEAVVSIQGKVATVAAPYDFWIDGKRSHCGHETFTLLKDKKGWKIASLTFSVNMDNCD